MYIKMVGDTTKYQGALERMNAHLIRVSGLIQHNSGFRLYLDDDTLIGDYSAFVYTYDNPNLGLGVYEYSDNNMAYNGEIKPSQEEQEKQRIEGMITKYVGDNISNLASQIESIADTLVPMYEIMMTLQNALVPQEEEKEPIIEDTPTDDNNKQEGEVTDTP